MTINIATPITIPRAVEIKELPNNPSRISKEGIIKDQIDDDNITPADKPIIIFSNLLLIFLFKKNTINDPNVVPINGSKRPITILNITISYSIFFKYTCNIPFKVKKSSDIIL